MNQFDRALAIRLEDGRLIVATPRPEDQDFLGQSGEETLISLAPAGFDTEGHAIPNELTVDVEGHALTLRLPTPSDAEALRKALMIGMMSATVVAAGAIASVQNNAQPTQAVAPAAPAPIVAPALRPATQAEQNRDLGVMDLGTQPGTQSSVQAPAPALRPATQAEQDRDLGVTDLGSQSTTSNVQAPSSNDLATQREQRLQDAESVPSGSGIGSPSDDSAAQPDTRETRSGPLESDR